jgi:hypothetical protein
MVVAVDVGVAVGSAVFVGVGIVETERIITETGVEGRAVNSSLCADRNLSIGDTASKQDRGYVVGIAISNGTLARQHGTTEGDPDSCCCHFL